MQGRIVITFKGSSERFVRILGDAAIFQKRVEALGGTWLLRTHATKEGTIVVGTKTQITDTSAPIESLELSGKARNSLKRNGILLVRDLLVKDPLDLVRLKGFGWKSLDEVYATVKAVGLTFENQHAWYKECIRS